MDKELVEYIKKEVTEEANGRAMSAGFNGELGDGGCKDMLGRLAFWLQGIDNEIPTTYDVYVEQYEREKDPEYEIYLKLKKKFESNK